MRRYHVVSLHPHPQTTDYIKDEQPASDGTVHSDKGERKRGKDPLIIRE